VSPVIVGAEAASPQPTSPPAASMRTSTLSAVAMVTPAIFIGFLSGSATGMASTRLMSNGGRVATACAETCMCLVIEGLGS
jgi:hypothetical protein